MSLQVSALPTSMKVAKEDRNRRSANFHPSIWGDRFLYYASNSVESDDWEKQQKLKHEIKKMLLAEVNKPAQKLELIDAIQRLGVSYHFETEIDQVLDQIYQHHQHINFRDDNDDLYFISLEFRLLRQQGYRISCDVFNKFKDNNGNFGAFLEEDIRGMLSLYEATHLRVHGETILDEALLFSTTHLESMAAKLSTPLAAQVKHALNRPLRRGLPRPEARHCMTIYQEEPSHNEVLLTFAKLDFNSLQKQYQKELSGIYQWWKDLGLASKLPYVRDRVVELYFWIVGVYFEPEYELARRLLTKVTATTSVIDDTYDVYGTVDELELFTSAVERWNTSAVDQLPDYMQIIYAMLLDIYHEMETEMAPKGKLYRVHYAKESMKTLVRNYFIEAKWYHENYVPTMDEYMTVALVTSTYQMLATNSFVGMGDVATKEAFEWSVSNPKLLRAASVICRLMDDIASHKFEQKRGHAASAVECFQKQYGATEEAAYKEFRKQITDAWKDLNEELLLPTALPMPLPVRILNFSRVIDVVYKDGDGYSEAQTYLKDYIASLFIDPVSI
ncbi:(-)-germacrene D synthase-like [Mangifera indica]|uniref:(-)-germacrene D synthase-like n=1 Tax=Mangifera indica TaxID=29780 RepID=UPI001CFB2458|nr:(-)-germacrene D synthase-like [Mangifera indica]